MAAAGTLLSDLTSSGGDGDLVQKILSDMNIPTEQPQRALPPPMPTSAPQSYSQSYSTQPMTMDSRIPTSHMIGNEHPSSADFAAAMQGIQGMQGMQGIQGMQALPGSIPTKPEYHPPSKNLYSSVINEIKIPLLVTLLFFIFSLPPIRILVAHYMPTLIRATGEFHMTGLVAVSMVVGLTFWFLQRIIAPLISL